MTRDQLVKRARKAINKPGFPGKLGQCLGSVRRLANAPGGVNSASDAWHNARRKKKGFGPAGTFEYWTGGSHGYGHIAISLGKINGVYKCISTDVKRPGRFDVVATRSIHEKWGLPHAGHADNVNGVTIKESVQPAPPIEKIYTATLGKSILVQEPGSPEVYVLAHVKDPQALKSIQTALDLCGYDETIHQVKLPLRP